MNKPFNAVARHASSGVVFAYAAVLISTALLFSGCATKRIADYEPASPSANERMAQESGLEVALDPFVESSRTKQFFDIDATHQGVAILHVRVSNKTAGQTFLVEKKDFELVPNDAAEALAADGNGSKSKNAGKGRQIAGLSLVGAGGALLAPGAMIIGVGLQLGGLAAESHAGEVRRNFDAKEMPDQTLSPGQSMEGFVYFGPIKKDKDWSQASTVKIDLSDTKTHRATELMIPLSR